MISSTILSNILSNHPHQQTWALNEDPITELHKIKWMEFLRNDFICFFVRLTLLIYN
jgi:hypothetical protein